MPTYVLGQSRLNLGLPHHVRSTPDSDRIADIPERQFRANFRLMHRGNSEGLEDILTSLTSSGTGKILLG